MIRLILASMASRRLSLGLSLVALGLSVALFLSVSRLQSAVQRSFDASVAGIDLIVAARGGELPILLASLFRLGNPTANLSWAAFKAQRDDPGVAWAVPIALGDSHRGFRVVATEAAYFDHLRGADRRPLQLAQGQTFSGLFDLVLGARVAQELGYQLGDQLALSHGTESIGAAEHDDLPFTVVGVLAPSGSPNDLALFVSLSGLEAIHSGWQSGRQVLSPDRAALAAAPPQPEAVTAVFVGLQDRSRLLEAQRAINARHNGEALSAVIPGVALAQLWSLVGTADRALRLVALLALGVALAGLMATTVASLNLRRQEMAVYRTLGAAPWQIAALLLFEALLITLAAALFGWSLVQLAGHLAQGWLAARSGLWVEVALLTPQDLLFLLLFLAAGLAAALLPAVQLYRFSLQDGLSPHP